MTINWNPLYCNFKSQSMNINSLLDHSDLASGDATTFESVGTESLTTATNSTAKEKINVTRENNKWQVIHLHQLIEDRETDSLLQV